VFTAKLLGTEGTWAGPTTPIAVPAKGHPGTLSVTFNDPYYSGVRLTWSKFATGSQSDCKISNDQGEPEIVLPSCHDNSIDLTPSHTSIVYTFTATKNGPPSQDPYQTKTVSVTLSTSANVSLV
jgi:hypothetical protein